MFATTTSAGGSSEGSGSWPKSPVSRRAALRRREAVRLRVPFRRCDAVDVDVDADGDRRAVAQRRQREDARAAAVVDHGVHGRQLRLLEPLAAHARRLVLARPKGRAALDPELALRDVRVRRRVVPGQEDLEVADDDDGPRGLLLLEPVDVARQRLEGPVHVLEDAVAVAVPQGVEHGDAVVLGDEERAHLRGPPVRLAPPPVLVEEDVELLRVRRLAVERLLRVRARVGIARAHGPTNFVGDDFSSFSQDAVTDMAPYSMSTSLSSSALGVSLWAPPVEKTSST